MLNVAVYNGRCGRRGREEIGTDTPFVGLIFLARLNAAPVRFQLWPMKPSPLFDQSQGRARPDRSRQDLSVEGQRGLFALTMIQ
jgi:hypothetical protein